MLKCRVIEDGAALQEIGKAWDDLAARSEFVNVFATCGFARAWWKAFGCSRRLRVVVVEDGSQLRLIAPFYSDDTAPRVWRLIGDFRADYTNFIFAAGDVESLGCLMGWLRRRDGWDSLILRKLPENAAVLRQFPKALEPDSKLGKRLVGLLDARFPLALKRWHHEHPWINQAALRKMAGLPDQYNTSWQGASHGESRRSLRQLRQRGALQFESVSDHTAIRERLPGFMDLHVAQWNSKGERSLFLDRDNRDFYLFLTEELCPSGAVRWDALTLNGRLIAAHFGFTWRGRLYVYKWCYDVTLSSHSPGTLLLAHIIQRAGAEGLEEVDLLKGREEYKARYASDIRVTASLLIRRSRLQAVLERMRRRASRRGATG